MADDFVQFRDIRGEILLLEFPDGFTQSGNRGTQSFPSN
jgi:hypothetical protein